MTWIPCGICGLLPCACHRTYPTVQTLTGTTLTPFTFQPTPTKLSEEDVERIAKRAAELVLEAIKNRLPLRVTRRKGSPVEFVDKDDDEGPVL